MLESFGDYEVVAEAYNGESLKAKIASLPTPPDLMLIDVNMPVLDGIATAKWLNEKYPAMKLVALSMNDADTAIIEMFKAGCCAYLLKDTHPTELEVALKEVVNKGYYNADASNINLRRLLMKSSEQPSVIMTEKEKVFLHHACSELTYKQIASLMFLSERTIDGYRESLFQKFQVQSRVGLCLEALRKGFVKL
jgi:DNA-binding NarL/FixJ family response regulator